MTGARTTRLREMMLNVSHACHRVRVPLSVLAEGLETEPVVVRKARAFEKILEEMPVFIQEGELLVGGRTMFMPLDEPCDVEGKKNLDFLPDAETLAKKSPGFEFFPRYATEEEKALGRLHGIAEGYVTSHCVAGYGNVLAKGFGGIADTARAGLAAPSTSPSQHNFFRAALICAGAASAHCARYAGEARRLARGEANPARMTELEEITRICDAVSTKPASTFREALQLILFTHVFALVESYNLMALGRMDQYLAPCYERDIATGRLDSRTARELLECLFIKLNDTSDLHTDNGLNIIVSGLRPDGSDGTSELSYLLLDVHSDVGLTDPQINIRVHAHSPDRLLGVAFRGNRPGPRPMVYNDDIIIPSLVGVGVTERDARGYCIDACQDILIGEKSDFYPIFAGIYGCHLLTILERVVDRMDNYPTFDELFEALLQEIRSDVKTHVMRANAADEILPLLSPTPFLSLTLEGCLEKGKDKTEGGATYNCTGFVGGGIVNVANSLAAIRKIVYEQGKSTAERLRKALRDDFCSDEALRSMLLHDAPKWGNNDPTVDEIGVAIADCFCEEVLKYRNPRGGRFLPGLFTHHQVRLGQTLRSTPDGRRRGESLAVSLSPSNGTAMRGPTGAILSASKVHQVKCPLGTSLDLSLQHSMFTDPLASGKFLALLRTYLKLGGMELQVNSFSPSLLREAQANPERHRDLVVRVWGFNAYFVTLKKEYQDELIARFDVK